MVVMVTNDERWRRREGERKECRVSLAESESASSLKARLFCLYLNCLLFPCPPGMNFAMATEHGTINSRGEDYESVHVHTVYQQIASHFSSTRYKVGILPIPTDKD